MEQYIHPFVKSITEKYASDSVTENNKRYDTIVEPEHGQLVYVKNEEGKMNIARIIDGKFWSNGRVSNYWSWELLNDKHEVVGFKSGYGEFYIEH